MKKIKVSILALSVLVGGAVLASAAKNSSVLVANTTDITITNVAPLVWSAVYDAIPSSPFADSQNLNSASIVVVDTDSKGKITGVVNAIQNWPTSTNVNAQSSWIGTVKGSIKASKMGQPTIQMTIKANGYSSPTTNVFIIGKQATGAGNASLNINFKSTSAPVPASTNLDGSINWKAVGSSKINFKPGITLVQEKKSATETAALPVDLTSMRELGMRVVSFGSKFGLIAGDMFGTGSVNSKNQFTVNLKDGSGGSNIQLKGDLATFAFIGNGTTNQIVTLSKVDEKGKIQGQAVTGTGLFSVFGD